MIASNYLKHPEALRFQRELFHNGYKNSPRIMRLMECVFKFAPEVPQWAKEAARKVRQLVQGWKGAQICLNFKVPFDWFEKAKELAARGSIGMFLNTETGDTWTGRGQEPKWVAQARIHGRIWEVSLSDAD